YDLVLAAPALQGAPTSLGISGSEGSELFAISKFPEARLVAADDPKQLQGWLSEGAIGAAVLQSASLPPELSQSAKRLSATSP
ncbi:hypothetical protein, partial [Pseudomonas aeruginosa]|uniref:hypothetical protein n=1 Tax=Pseudomonas aeruginosa TaxID=287 RepID=UPI001F379B18